MAPKMAVAPKQKQAKTYDELYRDLFDADRLVPGLRTEIDTLPGVLLPQLEQARAQLPTAEAEERTAGDTLAQAEIHGAPQAEVARLEGALRKATEAVQRTRSRMRVLEAAIPTQEALVKGKWSEVIAGIRTAYAPEYRAVVGELAAAAIRLAELVTKEAALRDTACAQLRRAARGAGLNPATVGPGMPAMGGMWERQVGELRHPNSNVSFWLREARKQGYDVSGEG